MEGKEKNDNTGEDYDVFGVIDFGDSHENPYVFDLATTIMYMMTQVGFEFHRLRLNVIRPLTYTSAFCVLLLFVL